MAWIGDVVSCEQRQSVLARFMTGQIFGLVFGQAAGGALSDLMDGGRCFLRLADFIWSPLRDWRSPLTRKDHPQENRSADASLLRGIGSMAPRLDAGGPGWWSSWCSLKALSCLARGPMWAQGCSAGLALGLY